MTAAACWDNRSSQHCAVSDYWPAARRMERVRVIAHLSVLVAQVTAERDVTQEVMHTAADGTQTIRMETTRVTLPANLSPSLGRVDTERVTPEHPHWPLVFMLVLTQLSVGAFAVLWLLDLLGQGAGLTIAALASLGLAGISLGASTLHLGRPVYAWRALKGLRRSWLSREVLTLSLFAGAASAFAAMLLFDMPGRGAAGLATILAGVAGVTCSARIYVVPARPAWFGGYTVAEFYSTALLLNDTKVRRGSIRSWFSLSAETCCRTFNRAAVSARRLRVNSSSERTNLLASPLATQSRSAVR